MPTPGTAAAAARRAGSAAEAAEAGGGGVWVGPHGGGGIRDIVLRWGEGSVGFGVKEGGSEGELNVQGRGEVSEGEVSSRIAASGGDTPRISARSFGGCNVEIHRSGLTLSDNVRYIESV